MIAAAISAGLTAGTYLSKVRDLRFLEHEPSICRRYKREEYFGCCWWAFDKMESKWSEVINNDKELVLYAAAFTFGLMASHMSYKKDRKYYISYTDIAEMPFLLATAGKARLEKSIPKLIKKFLICYTPFMNTYKS
jgi:hypothetical protein